MSRATRRLAALPRGVSRRRSAVVHADAESLAIPAPGPARRWHAKGVLCIGDAAHAMSPAGGVGIDLAIQDAVATARVLAGPLRAGALAAPRSGRILVRIQRRRTFPTTVIQTPQRVVHARVNAPVLPGRTGAVLPRSAGILLRILPALSVVPAFVIGIGPRAERAPRWARR